MIERPSGPAEYNASVDFHDSYYAAVDALRQQHEAGLPTASAIVHVPATLADAETSLKQIVVAEASEKHWKAAKDAAKLFKAIQQKLTLQAGYVVYRQNALVPSQQDPRLRGQRAGISDQQSPLPDADPGAVIVHRWRQRLCDKEGRRWIVSDDKLQAALEDAGRRSVRICEQQNANTIRGTESTGEFERYTPAEYIERARRVLGTIDLDPASSALAQQTVQATRWFSETDNGLEQPWYGHVWLNPPYHRELAPLFIDKLIQEIAAGRTHQAIVLTNNSTDTQWFFKAAAACHGICFTTGRIHFTVPNGPPVLPTQGQAFFYFGSTVGSSLAHFVEVFGEIGFCVEPVWARTPC